MLAAAAGELVAWAASPQRLATGAGIAHPAPVSDVTVSETPSEVREYAEQVINYVKRALSLTLEVDSDTLPILDHYLRSVPADGSAATELVIATAGAYFGEVVRRRLGGRWELGEEPKRWRVVLPAGLSFAPSGLVAAAIAQAELADLDTELDAPPRMKTYLQQALERMGDVSEEAYYSLSGRLDTIEHLHEVLVTVAAQLLGDAKDGSEGDDGEGEDESGDDGGDDGGDDRPDDGAKGGEGGPGAARGGDGGLN
jgi:hypothetical protein